MFIGKIYDGDGTYKNVEDAIKYMEENNFEGKVSVYGTTEDIAYGKTGKIYDVIKEYNKGKPLDEQILPTYPFGCRGIVGCLGVHICSISLGTYKRNHECIALFTGYNEGVLDTRTESALVRPGFKALSSLAMISKLL